METLENQFGGLNHQLVFGDTIEFFFTIVKKNQCEKLRKELAFYGDKKLCKKNLEINFTDDDTELGL